MGIATRFRSPHLRSRGARILEKAPKSLDGRCPGLFARVLVSCWCLCRVHSASRWCLIRSLRLCHFGQISARCVNRHRSSVVPIDLWVMSRSVFMSFVLGSAWPLYRPGPLVRVLVVVLSLSRSCPEVMSRRGPHRCGVALVEVWSWFGRCLDRCPGRVSFVPVGVVVRWCPGRAAVSCSCFDPSVCQSISWFLSCGCHHGRCSGVLTGPVIVTCGKTEQLLLAIGASC